MQSFLLGFLLLLSLNYCYGQKETSHWFLSPYGYLNFNDTASGAKMRDYNYERNGQSRASISDSLGNLLFHTDGRTFWNKNDQVLENGQGAYGSSRSSQTSFIFPKPGSKNKYYNVINELSSTNEDYEGFGWTIHYSLIDMAAAGGVGKVEFKNKKLTNETGDALAIFEGINNNYWIVTLAGLFGDELHAFKVSEDGIDSIPKITRLSTYGGGGHYNIKASPNGKYLVFARWNSFDKNHKLEIYSFKKENGTFSPKFELNKPTVDINTFPHTYTFFAYNYEFSYDSKNLFIMVDSVYAKSYSDRDEYSSIYKFDVEALNISQFKASKTEIINFSRKEFGAFNRMQLSPDNRIIIGSSNNFLAAIENINDCKNFVFTKEAFVFESWPGNIPSFPAFYFNIQNEKNKVIVDAGEDVSICSGTAFNLSAKPAQSTNIYTWTDTDENQYLGNDITIVAPNKPEVDTVKIFVKMETVSGCSAYDSLTAIYFPSRTFKINGSSFICPESKEILYWIKSDEMVSNVNWNVTGGSIISNSSNDSIKVNWHTQKYGLIEVDIGNSYECKDNAEDLVVNITKKLNPLKPFGPDTIDCASEFSNYSTFPTNGASYIWHVKNGIITRGQGKEKVEVKWNNFPYGYIWVEEFAGDEINSCHGRSDTLKVVNPKGFNKANIESISYIISKIDTVNFFYKIDDTTFYKNNFNLLRKKLNEDNNHWVTIKNLNYFDTVTILPQPFSDKIIYDYKISGFNVCDSIVESDIHNNIVLTAKLAGESKINLNWNAYKGWSEGIKDHEISVKIDDGDFNFLPSSISSEYFEGNLSEGFEYCYYIKTNAYSTKRHVLSNIACVTYEHPIFIPNIITPNGDHKNDNFIIKNLELYPNNRLQIFNRSGKVIFDQINYNNKWNGFGLPAGIYFYLFQVERHKQSFKGWIEILR